MVLFIFVEFFFKLNQHLIVTAQIRVLILNLLLMQPLIVTFVCIKVVNVYISFTKQTITKVHPRNRVYLVRLHINKTFDGVLPFST